MNPSRQLKQDGPELRSVAIVSRALPISAPVGRQSLESPKNETSSTSTSFNSSPWNVTQLRAIPSYYRLERTHASVCDVPLAEIVSRVVLCLQKESIHSRFDDQDASFQGETDQGVIFSGRLFAGSQPSITVVELQRQAGDVVSFHNVARSVLRAAKGMPPAPKRNLPLPPRDAPVPFEEGLELASNLILNKDRMDAQLIGLQSLVNLSQASNRVEVAQAIVNGRVFEAILSLIESWSIQGGAQDDHIEARYVSQMRRHALTVLRNCLSSLQQTQVSLDNLVSLVHQRLFLTLVEELRQASKRPHEACLAAQCLQHIIPSLPKLDGRGIRDATTSALIVPHANLELECQRLQQVLSSSIVA